MSRIRTSGCSIMSCGGYAMTCVLIGPSVFTWHGTPLQPSWMGIFFTGWFPFFEDRIQKMLEKSSTDYEILCLCSQHGPFSSMTYEGNQLCIYFLWLSCNLILFKLHDFIKLVFFREKYYFFRYFCRFWIKTQS